MLEILRYNPQESEDWQMYSNDIALLQEGLLENNYVASPQDIYLAWSDYSESMCAGWMIVDSKYDWHVLMDYLA